MPSSLRFFSINFDRAIAARSSADDVHPILMNLFEHELSYLKSQIEQPVRLCVFWFCRITLTL